MPSSPSSPAPAIDDRRPTASPPRLIDPARTDLAALAGVGFGDEIMATAAARALRGAAPAARVVVGDGEREVWSAEAEEIFTGNPHIVRLADARPGEPIVWLRNYFGHRPYLDYSRLEPGRRQAFAPFRAERGELFLTAAERTAAAAIVAAARETGRPVVSIEPHVAFGPNKDWGWDRWQALVAALRGEVAFVQPHYGRPLLAGVQGVSASFRGYAAVLAECDAHVGPEGALHHAAAALDCPAVVLFGGRIAPSLTGYEQHENLYVEAPGSPCGMIAACDHCRACFAAIDVAMVAAALRRQLAAHPARSSASSAETARAVARG